MFLYNFVCSSFCRFLPLSWQKYFLPWQKPNPTAARLKRNVRQFLHILASPGYAQGTIGVNVTWMERGFNAGPHSSIYPSIFNRLRAIARYCIWSEIATFSYPLAFNAPLGCSYWNSVKSLDLRKLESWGY